MTALDSKTPVVAVDAVRIGLGLGLHRMVRDAAEFGCVVDACEELGIDSLWLSEHATTDVFSPLVGLAVAAGRTRRIKLGTSVAVVPGREPALLAQDLGTLDQLSGGRMLPVFGLGTREDEEHQAFGVRADERARRMDEALPLVRRLLSGETVTHEGEFHRYDGISVGPQPTRCLDLWLGGMSTTELRRAGRLGDGWLGSFLSPAETARARQTINAEAHRHGRVIDQGHFGTMVFLATDGVPDELAQVLRRHRPDLPVESLVADSFDALRELIAAHVAGGLTKFVMLSASRPRDWAAWLATVAPHLRAVQDEFSPTRHTPREAAPTRLPIIDADCHVVEPFELWQRIPEKFRDRVWRREVSEEDGEVLWFEGRRIKAEWTTGTLSTPGAAAEGGRLDVDFDHEVDSGVWEPHRRLEVMDEQGIAVSVLFPSMMLGLCDVDSAELQACYAEVYNAWMAEFCSVDPIRLRWGALLPTREVDGAVSALRKAVDQGACTGMLPPTTAPDVRLSDPEFDPLWEAFGELGVPVVLHAVNPANNCLRVGRLWANRTQWQMGYPLQHQLSLLQLIDGGVLDRHPALRVGLFEADCGWLPHWLGRLDATYRKMALVSRVPSRSPVRQFLDQCVISGEPGDAGLAPTLDLIGADRFLFASDWPHQDGSWPDPIIIVRDRTDLDDRQKLGMLVHGPAAFFGIDLAELAGHLGGAWSVDAAIADLTGLLPDGRPGIDSPVTT
ncbi:LLM class flavin-dependent oxidoreductase [Lentzea sp. NBRC 102530]|uniref:LLM class flavin-dependent oxidoreductase n=1 Tax=Lentzea sp. NBRC 102530 TaxID=3032201 RepID=UPI0024A4E64C|nr:LLM class flavin-dependent oxidoreductase [Lentzea sp. NBRC 102530]GLY50575.1 hypothetical protein Lesp01_42310 [Lentzea sp. NBRC 102530]